MATLRQKIIILASAIGYHIIMEDDSDEEIETRRERQVVTKVANYAEVVVPAMTSHTFKSHFRLTYVTFESLVQRLSVLLSDDSAGTDVTFIDPSKQLMIAIWLLGNQDSFREVGDRFGVASSTAHRMLMRVVEALLILNSQEGIISWPDEERSIEIQQGFLHSYHFPGVVGAIDGSHIPIKAPSESSSSYINRKGVHSILLQGVCDNKLLFTDCYAGEVGSVHDACMFRRSDLCERMQTTPGMFINNSHILGDLAYPLKQHLLTGFKDNGRLSQRERKYNRTLSAARSCIERAFALLKCRWRRLKYLNMTDVSRIPKVNIACCILHNICILKDDIIDISSPDEDDDGTVNAPTPDADRREGQRKRTDIVNTL